jgi:phosphonate transport system substrate-binding protein
LLSRRFVLAAACGAVLSACGREPGDETLGEAGDIRFGIQRAATPSSQESLWSPLVSDLQATTSLKVKDSFFDSGAALVAALHQRKIDLALMSNAAALAAVRRSDAETFARPLPAASGAGGGAVLATGPRSRLTLARVLQCDRSLSLGVAAEGRDEALFAADAYLFASRGVGPGRCFRSVRPMSLSGLVAAVTDQKLDAAIVDLNLLRSQQDDGKAKNLIELWRSPTLPSPSLIWRRDLDPAIKEKLRQFLLTYGQNDAAQRQRLAALGLAGFAPADNSHLLVEREMEAAHAWLGAKASGDTRKETKAKAVLDAVVAERKDLEARTATPAAAQ